MWKEVEGTIERTHKVERSFVCMFLKTSERIGYPGQKEKIVKVYVLHEGAVWFRFQHSTLENMELV